MKWPLILSLAAATIALAFVPYLILKRRNTETEITDAPEAEADRREFRRQLGGWRNE